MPAAKADASPLSALVTACPGAGPGMVRAHRAAAAGGNGVRAVRPCRRPG
ncbi:hypothetical protein DESPIGER_2576 [Desulfovibrio piger]|uniref:Uncharacterized protein n=1 Tax=Desulfovibrio piger TaxID=901 RepID=A0A1K1LLN8_9BACT|nr:hypothetical protein DESPIGER_2576 [Desulfovibrio piger]